jgi:hypothetical protein
MSRLPEEVLSVPLPRSPGFPVDLGGAGELHAAFLIESRTCSLGWSHVQEIRVAAFVFLDVERLLAGPPWAAFRLSDKIQSAAL